MLSVLIPTYNYDVSALISTLHAQLIAANNPFEILVFEDGSTKYINTSSLSHTNIIINETNIGRVKARQFLAEKAKYDWLLFLDADVTPKNESFISHYQDILKTDSVSAVFGGFAYHSKKPENDYLLRWTYGKSKEEIPANQRNTNPYKVIISANYLVRKTVFIDINEEMNLEKGYGFDNYFGALLKRKNISIFHINNPVYHLGIEKSETYLYKKEQAALILLKLYNKNNNIISDNDLLNLFIKLKRWNLTGVFSKLHQWFKKQMRANLLGKNPNIKTLQLYRISFMCQEYRKGK